MSGSTSQNAIETLYKYYYGREVKLEPAISSNYEVSAQLINGKRENIVYYTIH